MAGCMCGSAQNAEWGPCKWWMDRDDRKREWRARTLDKVG